MQQVDELVAKLQQEFPAANISVDRPEKDTGTYWVDINTHEQHIVLSWNTDQGGYGGFGKESGYGEKADIILPTIEQAVSYVWGQIK